MQLTSSRPYLQSKLSNHHPVKPIYFGVNNRQAQEQQQQAQQNRLQQNQPPEAEPAIPLDMSVAHVICSFMLPAWMSTALLIKGAQDYAADSFASNNGTSPDAGGGGSLATPFLLTGSFGLLSTIYNSGLAYFYEKLRAEHARRQPEAERAQGAAPQGQQPNAAAAPDGVEMQEIQEEAIV